MKTHLKKNTYIMILIQQGKIKGGRRGYSRVTSGLLGDFLRAINCEIFFGEDGFHTTPHIVVIRGLSQDFPSARRRAVNAVVFVPLVHFLGCVCSCAIFHQLWLLALILLPFWHTPKIRELPNRTGGCTRPGVRVAMEIACCCSSRRLIGWIFFRPFSPLIFCHPHFKIA